MAGEVGEALTGQRAWGDIWPPETAPATWKPQAYPDFRQSPNVEDRTNEGVLRGYGGGIGAAALKMTSLQDIIDLMSGRDPLQERYGTLPTTELGKQAGTEELDAMALKRR